MKALVAILVACTLAAAVPSVQAQDKLRIGFLSTLTGPISGLAVDMQDGFRLGLKQAGGRLGGLETELIVADDQQNPDTGKQVFDKLVKKDRVQIVTGTRRCSSSTPTTDPRLSLASSATRSTSMSHGKARRQPRRWASTPATRA
jgi:ABC-type branched-subunit amino acid transport system substrate-binding protein